MFLIFLLLGIVVATFVVAGWMFYAAKAEADKNKEDSVVPITDLSSFDKTSISKSDASLSLESRSEDRRPGDAPKDSTSDSSVIEPTSFSISSVNGEVPSAGAAVVATSVEPDRKHEEEVRTLKEEVRLIREKAVIQAKNAIEVINKLREQVEQFRADNKNLVMENARMGERDKVINSLEAEKISLTEDLHGSRQEVEALRVEMDKRSALTQQTIEQLKADNALLKNVSFDTDQERTRLSQVIQGEYQERLDDLAAQLEVVRNERDSLVSAQDGSSAQLKEEIASVEELVSLKKAADVLREDREKLEAKIRELETKCTLQVEKNSFLQYELTKSRAQAMGMERIYENSRKQIEDLTRQVSDTRLDNKELKKQADVMEKSLNDFKRLNVELLKREKLSQFEIERSRGDLRDLERIYDGFRSRIEKVGMGEGEASDR